MVDVPNLQGKIKEFDTITDDSVGQAKPANCKLNKDFREQAKQVFELSDATDRTPYFRFDGPPDREVLNGPCRCEGPQGVTEAPRI